MPTHETEPDAVERVRALGDGGIDLLDRPFADLLLSRALLAAGHDALDLGAGTGYLTARMEPVVGDRGSVTAREVDSVLVELGRESTAGAVWSRGRLDSLPFGDGAFDAVLGCHAVERLKDPVASFDECRRVLRLGGRLSLALWCGLDRNPFFEAVAGAVEEIATGDDVGRDLASYRAAFERSRAGFWRQGLERAGFVMVSVEEQRLDLELPEGEALVPLYLHAAGLGGVLSELTEADREAVGSQIEAAIGAARDDDGRLPFRSFLAFGRAWRS